MRLQIAVDTIETVTRAMGIDGYVRQLNGWHRLAGTLSTLVRHALVVGIGVGLTDFVNSAYTTLALTIAVAWSIAVSVFAYVTAALSPQRVDEELGLQDGLTTWLGVSVAGRDRPMVAWLERDLDEQLARVPVPAIRRLGLRRLGALRYAVPILVVIFLLRLFDSFLPPMPAGPIALASAAGAAGAGSGGGGKGGDEEGSPSTAEAAKGEQEGQQNPTPPPPPDPGDKNPEAASEEPDSPDEGLAERHDFLDLDKQDSFAIPQFIGDGPSTREEALVAKEVVSEEPDPKAGAQQNSGTGDGKPEPETMKFEHAQERALRSRHVPDHEKPIVKSYFRSLVEGSK